VFAQENKAPVFILGGGSNIVFSDGVINVLALKVKIKGFETIEETDEYTKIKIGAGEIFDNIIDKTIKMNLSGLETLSAIPGTIGATPVQNVGAYGSEVKDTIVNVEVFDIKENIIKNISNEDCKFGYRDSIFKNKAKGQYIITNVVFKLKKVSNNFDLLNKREEIINTRWSKLPRPEELPNVGSFFKNPIVSKDVSSKILKDFPDGKFFDVDENMTKIPAGWLIDIAGLKGKSFGNVSIYDKNALVLVNNGQATKDDVINAKNEIIKIIFEKFGIILEQEPEMV
jgi:UDP-N-acetylmuramate dehydrogenase